jgi:hypothetical protein
MKPIIHRGVRFLFVTVAVVTLTTISLAQTRERLVDWRPLPIHVDSRFNGQPTQWEPLALLEVASTGHSIVCGEPFVADVNWVKELRFRIRNVSGKTIKFVRIYVELPEAKLKGNGFAFSLEYGKETSDGVKLSYGPERLLPGSEIELAIRAATYDHFRDLIAKESGATDFTKVFIGMTYIRFDDGAIWDGYRLPFH